MKYLTFIITSSLFLATAMSWAQDSTNEQGYTSAKIIDRPVLHYPQLAERDGREGWVLLGYIISEEGDVVETTIVESTGGRDFERAAINALNDAKYKPATLNGVAVSESVNEYLFRFHMRSETNAVGRRFRRSFVKISGLIGEQNLSEAEGLMEKLYDGERKTLYEDAWFWWLNFNYLKATGDAKPIDMIDSLQRAIISPSDSVISTYLEPDAYVSAIQNLYVLQVQEQDYNAAVRTFEDFNKAGNRVKSSDYYEQMLELLEPNYKQVVAVIRGDGALQLKGEIRDSGYWVHDLIRRSFSISNVEGELELVDIRCSRRNNQFAFAEGSTWSIPASWGTCKLYLKGLAESSFTVLEHPDENIVN